MITLKFTEDIANRIAEQSLEFRTALINQLAQAQSDTGDEHLRILVRDVYLKASPDNMPMIAAIKALRDKVGIGHKYYMLRDAKDFVEKHVSDLRVAPKPAPKKEEKKRVKYRGREMVEGWPEKIKQAQKMPIVVIENVEYKRIPYGSVQEGALAAPKCCHDCYVNHGEFHVFGCDVERCPKCGGQQIGCDCNVNEEQYDKNGNEV
jgi:ribosomal protein L7/L12